MIGALLDVMKWPFLNIALEWLCDHWHNSCHYSSGPSTLIVPGPLSYYGRTRSEPAALGFLSLWTWPFSPLGAIHRVLIDHRNHSADLWRSLRGHWRLSEEAVQRAELASELQLGEFLAFGCTENSPLPYNYHRGNVHYVEKLHLNGSCRKKMKCHCGCFIIIITHLPFLWKLKTKIWCWQLTELLPF